MSESDINFTSLPSESLSAFCIYVACPPYVSVFVCVAPHCALCEKSTELVNVLDSSDTVTVSGGSFTVNIQNGLPKLYHPMGTAQLEPHAYYDYN